MKLNDAVWGALFILLSVALLVHVQGFPTIPGQNIGPALFPGIIAVGLAVCGALLIVKGLAVRAQGPEQAHWLTFAPWVASPRHVLAFFMVIAVNVFYILLVDTLGFIPTAVIYLAVLFAVFGVSPRWNLPVAIAVTLLIHYSFYKMLKVPLPWGVLTGVAW
ncbi:MAG TPA: tripartite tricarboxylate transporter TctB family protein [Casimicrobiaceae bacterium]|nr:tripartite tricarboxylate transporter TctB family protein [Casimicrobiaceae bacterium]